MAGEAAYRQLGLDIVTLVPAGEPWQKADREVSVSKHRWAMTQASTEGVDYFEADAREIERHGWTYTMDTLESFPGDEQLVLILGADAAARLMSWHRADDVLERVSLAVLPRPGTLRTVVEAAVPTEIAWLDTPEVGISGTLLRERERTGLSIRFLVREPVWHYIQDNHVYV